jgi:hypothetical protein
VDVVVLPVQLDQLGAEVGAYAGRTPRQGCPGACRSAPHADTWWAGETWRSQRWDSFRLNTVGWMNELLGEQPPDAYLTGLEVVERLERLAASRPVREGVLDCSLWCEHS